MELWSIHKFSAESGMAHRTIQARLNSLKIEPTKTSGRHPAYTVKDFLRAYVGDDITAERKRETKERADKLALENEKTRGNLIEVDAVARAGESIFVAVRQIILSSSLLDDEKDLALANILNLKTKDWSKVS